MLVPILLMMGIDSSAEWLMLFDILLMMGVESSAE